MGIPPPRLTSLPPTSQLATLGEWMDFADQVYASAGLAMGQITTDAHDEALFLLLRTLDWPLDSDPACLRKRLDPAQRSVLRRALERRAVERVPAAYLVREAWLAGYRFYVDERVLIPRSYFVELIPTLADFMPEGVDVRRAVDVCTGSGCLAILMAHEYEGAQVDAIDISTGALAVAQRNVADHGLGGRVRLIEADLFANAPRPPAPGYDIILSNPPYEPSALCDRLPPEFRHEPRLALDGGVDGLDLIRRLLVQSRDRLAPHGIVAIEVGGLQEAMNAEFDALALEWMPTDDGSNCVCVVTAEALAAWKPAAPKAKSGGGKPSGGNAKPRRG